MSSLIKSIKKGVNVEVIKGKFKGRKTKVVKLCSKDMTVLLDSCFYGVDIIEFEGKKSYAQKNCPIHISNIKLS